MAEEIKVLHSVKILESMGSVSVLEVEFEDSKTAFMIAEYSEVSSLLDKSVLVSFRKDIRNGEYSDFVNTMTKMSIVSTLDKVENIKLYVNDIPDTGANIVFADLALAEYRTNCIVYCDDVSLGTSAITTWVDFRVLDRKRNSALMKVFNPEHYDMAAFKGKYLLCDIRKTKYGLQTQAVNVKEELDIHANPEMELARQFIQNELADDEVLHKEVSLLNLLEVLASYSEPGSKLETGTLLIQTAMEIAMAGEFRNLSREVDYRLLRRAFIANKLYSLTHNETQSLSKEMQSVMKLTSTKISNKKMIALIEENPSITMLEHKLMRQITDTVKTLLENTKSEGYVLSSNKVWGGK